MNYKMNPGEDMLMPATELENGMWVLPEDVFLRRRYSRPEEFREVTRLRVEGERVTFSQRWADGYQESSDAGAGYFYIVKKAEPGSAYPSWGIRRAIAVLEEMRDYVTGDNQETKRRCMEYAITAVKGIPVINPPEQASLGDQLRRGVRRVAASLACPADALAETLRGIGEPWERG